MRSPRSLLTIILVAVCIAPLAGCAGSADSPPTPSCLGLVIGVRSGSAGVSKPMVAVAIPDPLPVGSALVITGVSGSPNGDSVYSAVVEKGDSSYDTADNQQNTRANALSVVDHMAAASPQADLLGAIEATASSLRATGMSCTIHVYDSGLSTAGLVEFQQGEDGLLALDPASVIDRIPAEATLSQVTVVFETLGATSGDQPAPDSASLSRLTAIWKGIIERRGGLVADSNSLSNSSPDQKPGLPVVDVVPIPRQTIDFSDLIPTCTPTSTAWSLPEDMLFAPDLWALKDTASMALDPVVQILLEHPDSTATIVGHSASVGAAPGWTEVSEKRAASVRDYLISGGIEAKRISASGVGDTQPSCEDWDYTTGSQIETCAIAERRVELVVTGIVLCNG